MHRSDQALLRPNNENLPKIIAILAEVYTCYQNYIFRLIAN